MDKVGGAIAIIALLTSVTAIGYLGYNLIQPRAISPFEIMYLYEKIVPESGLVNTWYEYNNTDQPISVSAGPYYPMFIVINFTVNSGEWTFFSFETHIYMNLVSWLPGMVAGITIRFSTDGFPSPVSSEVTVNSTNDGQTVYLALQHVNKTLSQGSHNVTVEYWAGGFDPSGSNIKERSLLVQTLIP